MRLPLALFCLALPTLAQQLPAPAAPEKLVAFRGVATDVTSGLPLEGVSVELRMATPISGSNMSVSGPTSRTFKTKSDAKGEFSVDVPVGAFGVTPTLEGYGLAANSDRIAEVSDPPKPFAVRMIKSSYISGFTEDDEGRPLAGISLELIDPITQRILRTVGGADGSFRLGPVIPGGYVLRGTVNQRSNSPQDRQKQRLDYPPAPYGLTYYPSTADPESSAQIAVYAGVDVPGLRLRMRKATYFTVSGQVVGREASASPATLVRLTIPGNSLFSILTPVGEFRVDAPVAPDGSFRIERVLPGSYRAVILSGTTDQFALGGSLVNVSSRDVEDFRLVVMPSGTLSGRFVLESGEPAKRGGLLAARNETGTVARSIQLNAEGRFSLDGVAAGTYSLSSGPVTKIEVGGRTFEGSKFDFTPPLTGEMVVTVSEKGGTIRGILEGTRNSEKPVTGVGSVMSLAMISDRFDNARFADLSADGSFSVSFLSPGKYLVCAWSDQSSAVSHLLQWTAVPLQRIEQQCKPVTLKVNGSEQVQVRMTSVADVTR